MAVRTAYPTTRDTYKALNASARRRGDIGDNPIATQGKALGFVCRNITKGLVLTAGYAACTKTGNLIATLALVGANGQIFHSPSLDALSIGMGVVTAARFLIEASRLRSNKGSIAYDDASISQFEHHPDANCGAWADTQH